MSEPAIGGVLVAVGLVVFGLVVLVRRVRPGVAQIDPGPPAAILSYIAAAFGVLVGFVIVFLLGQTGNARQAIGDEATSIGTAFDEAQLFPEGEPDIQHALICYSRAVSEEEWPELADGRSASEADDAYRALIAAYDDVDMSSGSGFQPAAATNSFVQIGSISTARETRLVAAQSGVGALMWGLLLGAGAFVLVLLFVVSISARPLAQAVLLGFAGVFTAVLLILVTVLSNPFQDGTGPLTSRLIDENTERMVAEAPEAAARPCAFDEGA